MYFNMPNEEKIGKIIGLSVFTLLDYLLNF